jgi:putative ABC transport system ATP-binding protein
MSEPALLELTHARKYYASPGGQVRAIDDVSVTVAAGELVAILGPSGSGKTTLLLLAAGLLQPDEGSVRFRGAELAKMSKREALAYRRTKVGFVFQSFNLVAGLTAAENVAMPLLLRGTDRSAARRRALEALDGVGLAARAEHIPSRLSGGEQQRAAIARALVGEPKLILADEPTGNLDSETGTEVLELLTVLPRERGAATILVTHDTRIAGAADRMLQMRDGRLTEPEPEPEPSREPASVSVSESEREPGPTDSAGAR